MAKYAIDTRIPNMVYAAIAACPVPGGKLKSVDKTPINGARGLIQVVQLPNAVAVVADSFWRAKQALAKLSIDGMRGQPPAPIASKPFLLGCGFCQWEQI